MIRTFNIAGRNIIDIPSFYAEINRVFMSGEDWRLGNSLDALNDLLYGGYGAIEGREAVRVIWHDIKESRRALGIEETRAFLTKKLETPNVYNVEAINRQLNALSHGAGQTYFEIVIEIIADHQNIELVQA